MFRVRAAISECDGEDEGLRFLAKVRNRVRVRVSVKHRLWI